MAGGVNMFRIAAQATIAETKKLLISTAKREHAAVMAVEPRPERFVRTVDGVRGAQEEAVKPDGRIVYEYSRLDSVVQAALEALHDLSPVLSGEYRMAHTLFVDGVEARNLRDWDGRGEILISNFLPYSRKIEVGAMKMAVPGSDHVYEQAEFLLRQRFGNQARIKFIYRGIIGGGVAAGKAGNKSGNRFPALEIEAIG